MDRYSHLDSGPTDATLVDDGGQENAETVEHAVQAILARRDDPSLPVLERVHCVFLVHQLSGSSLTSLPRPDDDKAFPFLYREEFGGLRTVWQDKRCNNSSDYRGNAINEKDPPPASPAMSTIKEANGVSDQSTQGSSPSRGREKVGDSQSNGALVVEHGEVNQEAYAYVSRLCWQCHLGFGSDIPGNSPASNTPRSKRHAMKAPLVLQKAENVATKPQAKVIPPSHLAGCMRFRTALEGVSKSCTRQYCLGSHAQLAKFD
jgi:hypothetical protein